ncbi:hypothetical protein B0H12DRAFT_1139591 [Mycena haematopus]|nr:hypothetical protein B0H12DRAFT_1139591 [Mycena haematopus]
MSGRKKRPLKPPACDSCKARRVLCHPQPEGKPCPRCFEKDIACTTTPVVRGRPRKNVERNTTKSTTSRSPKTTQELAVTQFPTQTASPSVTLLSPQVLDSVPDCPDLTPELVAHFFECFERMPPVTNPVVVASSIQTAIRAVSFQPSLLPPQPRVLAMCIIALSSLVSFHEVVLGPGPLPETFADPIFFSSQPEVLKCGARRAAVCRALHAAALRDAWDTAIMLQVSSENAASCFLLEYLEQSMGNSGLSRPWASAYISHVRALAPIWRTASVHWSGFLMGEALMSTRDRKPILITHEDQLLLCGPEPPSQEAFLASLETAASSHNKSNVEILLQSVKPFLFHITSLARQLWGTINGDHLQSTPLSESAVMQFLSALSLNHAIVSHLLARVDTIIAASHSIAIPFERSLVTENTANQDTVVRGCAYGIVLGFTALALPLYTELARRIVSEDADTHEPGPQPLASHARDRMRLLATQAQELTSLGVRELARTIRYLSAVRFVTAQRKTLCDYARFALDEAEARAVVEPERVRDLQT